jgi:PPOX class probable FMN-dependent enzyme
MEYDEITSKEQLRSLYSSPMELVVKKQKNSLDEHSEKFISLSPFVIISTAGSDGLLDASPRGESAGFIKVLDDRTIAIPDRPGNNRLDSLTNIIENPQIGIVAVIPGFKECLRINGSAKIVTNSELLEQFEHSGKLPISAIVISIQEVYFHCAKAIARAKLWEQNSHVSREEMPSLGRILMSQIAPEKTEDEIKEVEELIENRVLTTLY